VRASFEWGLIGCGLVAVILLLVVAGVVFAAAYCSPAPWPPG